MCCGDISRFVLDITTKFNLLGEHTSRIINVNKDRLMISFSFYVISIYSAISFAKYAMTSDMVSTPKGLVIHTL